MSVSFHSVSGQPSPDRSGSPVALRGPKGTAAHPRSAESPFAGATGFASSAAGQHWQERVSALQARGDTLDAARHLLKEAIADGSDSGFAAAHEGLGELQTLRFNRQPLFDEGGRLRQALDSFASAENPSAVASEVLSLVDVLSRETATALENAAAAIGPAQSGHALDPATASALLKRVGREDLHATLEPRTVAMLLK